MSKGFYVVIEGLDGSGKTTQYEMLVKALAEKAVGVREPGGTDMAEKLRLLIKDGELQRAPRTNVYLFAAARADLVEQKIRPAVKDGKVVVSDRNWLSSLAYQTSENVDAKEVIAVNKLATQEFFEPDLTIFIDVDAKTRSERMQGSAGHGGKDYFDNLDENFFVTARETYLKHLETFENHAVIYGQYDPDSVHDAILQLVNEHLAA